MNNFPSNKLIITPEAPASVLGRALRAQEDLLKTQKTLKMKALSMQIVILAYQMKFITSRDFMLCDRNIQENGFLKISRNDENYTLFRELAQWL